MKGLFYGIGHKPNSQIVAGQIELDPAGYVVVRSLTRSLSTDRDLDICDLDICDLETGA